MTNQEGFDRTPDPVVAGVEGALAGTDARALHGYFAGSTGGTWRLYLSLDLCQYVEGRDEALLYRKQLSTENPLAGSVIWVKADAMLVSAVRVEAKALYKYTDPKTQRCHPKSRMMFKAPPQPDRTPRC